jgi:hypothetical protein
LCYNTCLTNLLHVHVALANEPGNGRVKGRRAATTG